MNRNLLKKSWRKNSDEQVPEKFVVKLNHQLDENSHAVFFKERSIFIYLENITFLDLDSIANIDQHKTIFQTVYSMMSFGKKNFQKIWAFTIATNPKKICRHIFSKH